MDFPTLTELKFSSDNLDSFESFLDLNYCFNMPCFINVERFNKEQINQIISLIRSYCHKGNRYEYGPYPLYLVSKIIEKENFDWRYFVPNEMEISRYFRRKIYLKDTNQMKELKTFQIYRCGIGEQDGFNILKKLNEVNEIYFSLKKEKIQHFKLNKIIESFSQRK